MSAVGPDRRIPERFRFWQGQALNSRDLNDVAALAALMKCWHNRALHNTFGIVEGLKPDLNDVTVTVDPGTAYDVFGCSLDLRCERSIALPAFDEEKPQAQILVLRRAALRRDKACCGQGNDRPPWQELEIGWVPAPSYTPLMGVPLAAVENEESGLNVDVQLRVRAERRPLIGMGATIPGETDWQAWSDPRHDFAHGLEVTVDTSAAGFTQPPCYFAWLQGATPSNLRFLLPYWERVVNPGATRFTFSLWLPSYRSRNAELFPSFLSEKRWFSRNLVFSSGVDDEIIPMTIARRELSICWLGMLVDGRTTAPNFQNTAGGDHVII